MNNRTGFRAISIAAALATLAGFGFADIIYVRSAAPPGGTGASWASAYSHLQNALAAAQAGDQIWVAEGIYRPDETSAVPAGSGDRAATFQLVNGAYILGGFRGFTGDEGINNGATRPLNGVTARPVLESQLSGDLFENDGNASAVPLDPVGNWLFDAQLAGVTPDESNNALDATLLNGASIGAGTYGSVLSLTAEGQHARVSNSSLFSFTNDFSVAFWVRADVDPNGATLIDKSHGASNGPTGWAVQSTAGSSELRFAVGTGSSFPETFISGVLDNSWHHICYTVSLTPNLRVRGYRDGALVADVTYGFTTISTNSGDLFFGRHFEILTRMFVGELDGIALFARALNDNEVAKLANPIMDNSFHVVTGNGVGASTVVDGVTITRGNATNLAVAPHDLGGGLLNHSPAGLPTIRNCRFLGNRAAGGAGIYNHQGCNLSIENCSFEQNLATTEGGAIYNNGNSPSIALCTFRGNNTQNPNGGGALFNRNGANPTVSDCTFDSNAAYNGASGGAICNHEASNLTLLRCSFSTNSSTVGGAIYSEGSSSTDIRNCSFTGNSAAAPGGAITNIGGSHLMLYCTFNSNSASSSGGAIHQDGGTPTLRNCDFHSNSAAGNGGAINNHNAFVDLSTCVFVDNRANGAWPHGGGAVTVIGPPAILRAVNSTFIANNAVGDGGAIRVEEGGQVHVHNSLFDANSANQHGGALNMSNSAPQALSRIVNCTFSQNGAGNSAGGAIHIGGGPLTLVNSILWGNVSTPSLTLYNSGGVANVSYSNVEGIGGPGPINLGAGMISVNPQFNDPNGPDNIVGTIDDDLTLAQASACIDGGSNVEVPGDYADLDGDGSTSEAVPFDLLGNIRFLDATCVANTGVPGNGYSQIVDMGAYEFVEPDCDNDGIGDDCDSVDYIEITAQPQSQTVCAGEPVLFSVSAAGAPPLSYQWYFNGLAILVSDSRFSGAQQNALLVISTSSELAGQYHAIIDGVCSDAVSNTATLNVTVIPGDINESGAVDIADLTGLLSNFGAQSGASFAGGDLDGDGDVDLNDLTAMLSAFGSLCS